MITELYIDGQKLDQYKDENVNVVSSVASIKDLSKNTSDYSNSFTLPASGVNNQILKHYYDFNIDNTFDARKTTTGEIHIGGILFKSGKWQLQKVNVKQGDPESYTINFSGKLRSIKDLAGSLELKDLDLTAFDHDYDSANVKLGLTTTTFLNGDIVYTPLVKKQYFFNANGVDNQQSEELANIAYNAGDDTGIIWNDLKPSLKLIRIIEAIEVKLGITFSRDFFATSEFSDLFLWLNPDKSKENINFKRVNFNGGDDTYINFTTDIGNYSTVPWIGTFNPLPNKFKLFLEVTPDAGFENVDYKVKYYLNGDLNQTWEVGGTNPITTFNTNEIILQDNDNDADFEIYFEVECDQELSYTASLLQRRFINNNSSTAVNFTTTASSDTIPSDFIVSENMPKIKIIDFLKGILSMYKLVIIPTSDSDYYVDTISNYYSKGKSTEITRYIDWKAFDVERGDILNTINFKFQDPTTIGNIQYKKNNRVGYGDEDLKLYTDETKTELLDGESLEIELPFEQILYDRLFDIADDKITQIQYGAIIDDARAAANPKPHIHYSGSANVSGNALGFITDSGFKDIINTTLNTPLHGNFFVNPSFTTTFDDTFSTWDSVRMQYNLYTNHYKDYVDSIFNIKKRTVKHKAYLPLHILTKLELNDALLIKGNYFRIDKYTYNLLTGATDFELVNVVLEDGVINRTRASTNNIYVGSPAITKYEQLINTQEALPSKIDLGDGTDWVSLDLSATVPNLLEIAFDRNTTYEDRTMTLEISANNQTVRIYLYQYAANITSDTDTITSDNNIITSDNG